MFKLQRFGISQALTAAATLTLLPSKTAHASFYPPGYVVERTCQTQGPVEVCTLNHHYSNYPRISLTYAGPLITNSWGRVSAFVKLNGRSGVFPMRNANYAEHLTLAEPQAYLCHTVDSNLQPPLPPPPASGGFTWCKHTRSPGGGGLTWEVEPIPQNEVDLYFYARNEYGVANAWDIEVAFVNESGEWDSNLGENFRFRFE